MNNADMETLRKVLLNMSSDKRSELLESLSRPVVPAFTWNSSLSGFKMVLKFVEKTGASKIADVKHLLYAAKIAKADDGVNNFGIIGNETGIFSISDSGEVRLTSIGKELASMFDDAEVISPLEMVVLRGLLQQGVGYVFLGEVAKRPDGITREEVLKIFRKIFGSGSGTYFTGYYAGLYDKLGIIEKLRKGKEVIYKLKVPLSWGSTTVNVDAVAEDDA